MIMLCYADGDDDNCAILCRGVKVRFRVAMLFHALMPGMMMLLVTACAGAD